MIDYTVFATKNIDIINNTFTKIKNSFIKEKTENGWKNTCKFSNSNGIKIYLRQNNQGNFIQMFVCFSPHSIYNGNMHNANSFNLYQAQQIIIDTFEGIGVNRENIIHFYISKIEIGVNFKVYRDTYYILNSALMFGKFFFRDTEFPHYRIATNEDNKNKYLKLKFYIKSEQRKTKEAKTYHELGYCDRNIMRFELKLKRANKFKFLDFNNAECLFKETTDEILKQFLLLQYDKMFFFSLKEINTKKLTTKTQIKNWGKWQVKKFWETLDPKKRSVEIKKYIQTPKNFDLKFEIKENIMSVFSKNNSIYYDLKNIEEFPTKNLNYENTETSLNSITYKPLHIDRGYIDIGKMTNNCNENLKIC